MPILGVHALYDSCIATPFSVRATITYLTRKYSQIYVNKRKILTTGCSPVAIFIIMKVINLKFKSRMGGKKIRIFTISTMAFKRSKSKKENYY